MAKRGLGKGLDALFIDNNTEDGSVTTLKISEIEPNKDQPRKHFREEGLSELADSIRIHGVLQPLVVRPLEQGGYQLVAGERRWRACRRAGLTEVPVVIRDLTEEQTLEIAIIENLQREDLSVVELAQGYQLLIDQYGMTQEQVAARVGKSRSAVANTIRLLALPEPVLGELAAGRISAGHAKALLAFEDLEEMVQVAQSIQQKGFLVRDIEKMARMYKQKAKATALPPRRPVYNKHYREIELALSDTLGTKVTITPGEKKNTLALEFYSLKELLEYAARLGKVDLETLKNPREDRE